MGHSTFGGAGILSTERLIGLVHSTGRQADPVIRQEFGELLSQLRAARYTQEVLAAQGRAGEAPGPEIAVNKIALSNNMKRLAEFVATVLGPGPDRRYWRLGYLRVDFGGARRRGSGWAAEPTRS